MAGRAPGWVTPPPVVLVPTAGAAAVDRTAGPGGRCHRADRSRTINRTPDRPLAPPRSPGAVAGRPVDRKRPGHRACGVQRLPGGRSVRTLTAPVAPPANPRVPAAHAGQLALYVAADLAVLAPRGWHCIAMYGSGGAFLLVTPRPYTATTLPDFSRLTGPAVELSLLNGENSGRDQVAEVFSRLFPFKHAFIRSAAANHDVPPDYPQGRFPAAPSHLGSRSSQPPFPYGTPTRHGGQAVALPGKRSASATRWRRDKVQGTGSAASPVPLAFPPVQNGRNP